MCAENGREADKANRAEIARLVGELAEARRDQARYRALRRGQKWSVINGIGDTLRADELDAAIDAAIASEPTPPQS